MCFYSDVAFCDKLYFDVSDFFIIDIYQCLDSYD